MNWRVFGSPMPVMVGRVVPGSLLPRAGAFSQGYVQPLAPVAPNHRGGELQWPTPRASAGGPEMKKLRTPGHTGVNLATAVHRLTPGALNPQWVEWLCGFPQGWTA